MYTNNSSPFLALLWCTSKYYLIRSTKHLLGVNTSTSKYQVSYYTYSSVVIYRRHRLSSGPTMFRRELPQEYLVESTTVFYLSTPVYLSTPLKVGPLHFFFFPIIFLGVQQQQLNYFSTDVVVVVVVLTLLMCSDTHSLFVRSSLGVHTSTV